MDIDLRADGSYDMSEVSKIEAFKNLSKALPLNEYGLPQYIYRADLVPQNLGSLASVDRFAILDRAAIRIDYEEGFPTFLNGDPLWARMPYEPENAYRAFTQYLEIPHKTGSERQVGAAASALGMTAEMARMYYVLYYWQFRARAYEMFVAVNHAKQRERKIMTIEGAHFAKAEAALEIVHARLMAKLQDDDEMMDTKPKELVEMMDKLVKIQRVSVGLPAQGSNTYNNDDAPKHASLEVSMRHLANEAGVQAPQNRQDQNDSMNRLLDSPEDLEAAQELIVRMSLSLDESKK